MLLAVDAGNTDLSFGLHDGVAWRRQWRVPSGDGGGPERWRQRLAEALRATGAGPAPQQVVISSVVPRLNESLRTELVETGAVPVLVVGPSLYPQLPIEVTNPAEMGTDLVANAVAAYARFGQACLVIDFGTALTYTALDDAGSILGVAIAPGLHTALRALSLHAAQLPEVPLELPRSALGSNTTEAIQAGVVLGYAGMVKYLIERMRAETGLALKTIATGGLSHVLHPLHRDLDAVDPDLTLEGLRLIAAIAGADKG